MPARKRKTTANNTSKLRQFHCLCSRIDRQGRLQGFDNHFVVITGTFGWPLHHVPPASIYVCRPSLMYATSVLQYLLICFDSLNMFQSSTVKKPGFY